MIKRAILFLFLAAPSFGSMKYDYADPKLNDEIQNIYKEGQFPNIIYGRASTMTITFLSVSTISALNVSASTASIVFVKGSTISVVGVVTQFLTASTGTINSFMVVGDNGTGTVPLGRVGQVIETSDGTSYSNAAATGVGKDQVSVLLTPGGWSITGRCRIDANGATISGTPNMFIGTTVGDNFTGASDADNYADVPISGAVGALSVVVPNYIQKITSSTTYYAKVHVAFSVATPKLNCRLTAIRIF